MSDAPRTQEGDLVIIHGHRLGEPERIGEVLEVLGTSEHERYRVRWDDERESIFYPSSDAVIKPARERRGRTVATQPDHSYPANRKENGDDRRATNRIHTPAASASHGE